MPRLNGRKIALFIVVALASLHLGAVNAQLTDHGTYFTDETTHLDWLNNTPLAGQSYNSVLNGFGGYTTSGWRFATASELQYLVETYVGIGSPRPPAFPPGYSTINFAPDAYSRAFTLIGLLGVNVSFGNPPDSRATSQHVDPNTTEIATQGWYDDQSSSDSRVGIFDLIADLHSFECPTIPCVITEISGNVFPPNDFHGSNVSAILVRGPDAAALLSQLATDVAGVGPGKSLANKVALAQTYYAVPNVPAACAVLTDFGNEVRAQRGKKLTTELADDLAAEAQAIMTAIGCD